MRQPWFASTMTSRSGNDSRTACDHREVDAPVARMEAQLDCAHACSAERGAAADALVGVDELAARRVREDATAFPAEQPPHGLAPSAPEKIPHRDLDDPVAPVVEVDRLDDPVHGVGVRYVEADEQPLEERAIGQRRRRSRSPRPRRRTCTITTVASWNVRGSGSQAATNGGSSG